MCLCLQRPQNSLADGVQIITPGDSVFLRFSIRAAGPPRLLNFEIDAMRGAEAASERVSV